MPTTSDGSARSAPSPTARLPAAAGDVVEVHRLADDEVAVRVEAPAQLGAVVLEVALDLELLPQPERAVLPAGRPARGRSAR